MKCFQVIDFKSNCPGVYYEGGFHKELPVDCFGTWQYSTSLKNKNVEYAKVYCQGKSVSEVCPSSLRIRWAKHQQKVNAFYSSIVEAKVDLESACLFDVVPEKILVDFCDVKNDITEYVFKNYKKPENYDFSVDAIKMLADIAKKEILCSDEKLPTHCVYNFYGSKTGRLGLEKGSFPILTLAKKDRGILKPVNDCFVSIDYNSAEVRTLLYLAGKENPERDLHDFNTKNVYGGKITRDEAKKAFFSWLYNPNYRDDTLERIYNRDLVLEKFFKDGKVTNRYGRIIETDRYHALNYLVQSTLTDIFLKQSVMVHKLLESHQTYIAFLLHDNLILDVKKEEKDLIKKCVDSFCKTDYGWFWATVKVGKDLLSMKEIRCE